MADAKARKRPRVEWTAVEAVDGARVIYNRPCQNRPRTDEKGLDATKRSVQAKTDSFCACFSPSVRVRDLGSGKEILKDGRAFRTRYQTVFRESGTALEQRVLARAVFESARGGKRSFVLDREQHASLITPVGAMLDGTLGLRGPREQGLWALYEVDAAERQIAGVWLAPAAAPAAGAEGEAGEDQLEALRRTTQWGAFAAVVEQRLGAGWRVRSGPLHSVRVGSHELQGRRPTMEDEVTVESVAAPHLAGPTGSPLTFLGVYDGHGGRACARFAAEKLHAALLAAEAFERGAVLPALREAFLLTDDAFRQTEADSGACALVALIGGGRLFVAHVGDSRAVLCSGAGGAAVRLTEDHKPDERGERARIERAGGEVVFGGRCWRVTHPRTQMMLATSRSLGDIAFKQSWERAAAEARVEAQIEREAAADDADADAAGAGEAGGARLTAPAAPAPSDAGAGSAGAAGGPAGCDLSIEVPRQQEAPPPLGEGSAAPELPQLLLAEPTVAERPLCAADRFVILACDGVWDVLTDQQACDCVRSALAAENATPTEAAKKLAGEAYAAGSTDNISVVVAAILPYL